jgi:tetratricopeptide (TPR) repeat protein
MNASYRIALADIYYRKVRLDEAEAELRRAIRNDPQQVEARLKLAEILLIRREYLPAMEQANDALRIDPQHAKGYFLKGWIHMEAGDTALAISSFRTSVERDPTFYKAYVQLGLIHAAKHDPLALDYYNSALEIKPSSVEAWYGLGMFAQEHGMDSVALGCYAQIKQLEPQNPLPWYNTGFILLEHQRKAGEAREQFNEAIVRDPLYAEAYFNRGLTYEYEGRLDSAVTDFRRALALAPDLELATDGLRRLGDKVTLRK